MTTVAYDGYSLATDSQSTKDNTDGGVCPHCSEELHEIHLSRKKMWRKEDVVFNEQQVIAWCGAGDRGLIEALSYALIEGIALEKACKLLNKFLIGRRIGTSCRLLIVTDVTVWEVECTGHLNVGLKEITVFPHAIGSGAAAAKLAMKRYGMSAMAAVAMAIDSDPWTGGEVSYIQCRNTDTYKIETYTYTEEDILELINTNKG